MGRWQTRAWQHRCGSHGGGQQPRHRLPPAGACLQRHAGELRQQRLEQRLGPCGLQAAQPRHRRLIHLFQPAGGTAMRRRYGEYMGHLTSHAQPRDSADSGSLSCKCCMPRRRRRRRQRAAAAAAAFRHSPAGPLGGRGDACRLHHPVPLHASAVRQQLPLHALEREAGELACMVQQVAWQPAARELGRPAVWHDRRHVCSAGNASTHPASGPAPTWAWRPPGLPLVRGPPRMPPPPCTGSARDTRAAAAAAGGADHRCVDRTARRRCCSALLHSAAGRPARPAQGARAHDSVQVRPACCL